MNIRKDVQKIIYVESIFLSSQCKRRLAHSAVFGLHVNEPNNNMFQDEISPKMNFRRTSPL